MRIRLGNIEIQKINQDYFLYEKKSGYELSGLDERQISDKLILFIDEYRNGKGLLEIEKENLTDLRFIEFLILNCEYQSFTIEQFYELKELLSELDLSTSYYSNLLLYKLSRIHDSIERISCSYDIEVYHQFELMMKELVFKKINSEEFSTMDYKNIILKCLSYKDTEETINIATSKKENEVVFDYVNKTTIIQRMSVDHFKKIVDTATSIFEIKINEKTFLVIDKKYMINTILFDYLPVQYNKKSDLTDFELLEIRKHHFYYKLTQNKKLLVKYGIKQKEISIYFDENIPGVVLENGKIYCKNMDSFKDYFIHKINEDLYFTLYFFQKIFNLENLYMNEKIKYKKIDENGIYYKLMDNMIQFIMQDYIYNKLKNPKTYSIAFEKKAEQFEEPDSSLFDVEEFEDYE